MNSFDLSDEDIELLRKSLENLRPGYLNSSAQAIAVEQRIAQVLVKLEQPNPKGQQ